MFYFLFGALPDVGAKAEQVRIAGGVANVDRKPALPRILTPALRLCKRHALQRIAAIKGVLPDRAHAAGNGDLRQVRAPMEGEHSDQSNALGDDDLRQAEAVLERAFPDHDKPFGQYDACERAALPKCPAGNRARALPNDKFARSFVRIHPEQMVAQIERAVLPVALVVPVRRIFKCQAEREVTLSGSPISAS